jgi:hypothetical protein
MSLSQNYGSSDVDESQWTPDPNHISSWVAEAIPALETALLNGTLDPLLNNSDLEEKIGPVLIARYASIAASRSKHDRDFRQNWTAVIVQAFQALLQHPQKCFPAKAGISRGKIRTLLVSHHQGDATLRDDQAVSARRWGIWFDFENETLARLYADRLVRSALQKLESNICSLRYVETTYLAGYSKISSTARYDYEGIGGRFEHLMYDVLNELQPYARFASLAEDLLERTDLRVNYPFLTRNRGARIQVSLVAEAEYHRNKFGSLYLPGEFICLTPIDLAMCALSPPTVPLFQDFGWEDFWASLGEKYDNEVDLAHMFHDLFVDALSYPRVHPLGPMWILPLPLRDFIRTFTQYCAAETTGQIREREKSGRKFRGSVRKFTTGRWKTELADSPSQT